MALYNINQFNEVVLSFEPINVMDTSQDNAMFNGYPVENSYNNAVNKVNKFIELIPELGNKLTSMNTHGLTGTSITPALDTYKTNTNAVSYSLGVKKEEFVNIVQNRLRNMDEGERKAYQAAIAIEGNPELLSNDPVMAQALELEKNAVAATQAPAPIAEEAPKEFNEVKVDKIEETELTMESAKAEDAPTPSVTPEGVPTPSEIPTVTEGVTETPAPMAEQTVTAQIPGSLSPGTTPTPYAAQTYNLNDDQYRELVATVYAEATERPEYVVSDTMGVTSAILNRADNAGGDVIKVISADGQFNGHSPSNKKFNRAMNDMSVVPPEMLQAINTTLAGNRNTKGLYFSGDGVKNSFR